MREDMKIIEALKTRNVEASVAAVREPIDRLMRVALGFEDEADARLSRGAPAAQEI
jgi:hypothetical protein